jgi:serine/threonine protein phosphatase PrpC
VPFFTTKHIVGANGPGEDRAGIIPFGDGLVIVVADGAGGTGSGAEAADMVVQATRERILRARPGDLELVAVLRDIDDLLAKQGNGGQAAAVVAAVTSSRVTGASVGDCGAWLIDGNDYRDLTRAQERKPLLGDGGAFPVPFGAQVSGTLLLATDGLLKYAPSPRICLAARDPDLASAGDRLVSLVRLRSGDLQDDVGLVLVRYERE